MRLVNSQEFENEVLKSDKVVAVKFFANWCGPCKMMSQGLSNLPESDKYEVVEVDIEASEDIAEKYGIMSIPAMVYFKDGEEVKDLRTVGFVPVGAIEESLNKLT